MDQHFNVCSVIFIHLDFHTLILWLCRLLFLLCSRKTGIEFAVDVGCLSVGDRGGNYITAVKDVVEKDHINAQVLSGADVRSQFPFLSISNRDEAVFESHFAGYISPRRLVKAQIAIAKKNGCQHIQEVVRSVTRVQGRWLCHGSYDRLRQTNSRQKSPRSHRCVYGFQKFVGGRGVSGHQTVSSCSH